MAAKITGKFAIGSHEFRFTAIAFGRIGGQNVGAKLSKTTQKELARLGYDPEEVVMTLQRSLLQGDITIPDTVTKDSFVDS